METILSLDLGSRCGWAVTRCSGGTYHEVAHGYVDLVPGENSSARSTSVKKAAKARGGSVRSYDPRPAAFASLLLDLEEKYRPDGVAFEDVLFHNSRDQSQLWAAFKGAMWATLRDRVFWIEMNTGAVKRFATGRGDAQKERMLLAVWELGINVVDDNEADALMIGFMAAEKQLGSDRLQNYLKKISGQPAVG